MQLELTGEEAAALLRLLNRTIEDDRYPLSPRTRVLRGIRAKLSTEPPEPPRRDRPHPRSAIQGGRRGRRSGVSNTGLG